MFPTGIYRLAPSPDGYPRERGVRSMKTVAPISAPQMAELAYQLHRAGYGSEDIDHLLANMSRLTGLLDNLRVRKSPLPTGNWLDVLVVAERTALQAFFGQDFDLTRFCETLEYYGHERLQAWKELGLEPHFLPAIMLTKTAALPGWSVRPNDFYWDQLEAGNLLRTGDFFCDYRDQTGELKPVCEAKLGGETVLVDTRLKPRYKNGKQMWASDKSYLGGILDTLRAEGQIQPYAFGSQASRFGVSAAEWGEHIRPAVAKLLGLGVHQVRLETALEANVIPQIYREMARVKDGTTNTWTWYEERFESSEGRLGGGDSDTGGLASVDWSCAEDRDSVLSFRPLGVLDT